MQRARRTVVATTRATGLLDALDEPAWLCDPRSGQLVVSNAAAREKTFRPATLAQLMAGAATNDWNQICQEAVADGTATFPTAHGWTGKVSLFPLDRLYLLVRLREASPTSPSTLLDIVGLLPDVVFRCEKGRDGKIYWTLNEGGLAREMHLTTAEIRGRPLEELFPPEAVAHVKPHFEAAFAGDAHEFVNEIGGRFFRHFPQPVRGPDGRVTAVVGFITEVTALVRAERAVQELNAELVHRMEELDAANEDLRAFDMALSHDLRRPLTVIENYRHLLARFTPGLPDEGKGFLERMGASIRGMDNLIEDVLNLSDASRSALRLQTVDLTGMARDVVAELREGDPSRNITVDIEPALWGHGDPRLLRIALSNLLHNAWKFSSKKPHPHIWVGGGPDDLWVRDNGAGFDPAHAQGLFEPFTRLHDRAEFPGTGIGLSTVQRIVRRHGGRVWAEGRPGHGATFHLSLPKGAA